MKQLAALEFKQTPDDFKYESVEDFKEKTQGFLEYLLKQRKESYGHEEEGLPTMPIIVSAVFEDMSGVETMIFPQSRGEKNACMEGIKQMLQKYHVKKNILCVIISMEAWFSKIDTSKDKIPFKNELTEEQLERKAEMRFRNNQVEKETKIIVEYQTPEVTEGKLSTKAETIVYNLFEDFLLVLDEENTEALNSEDAKTAVKNPAMRMFDPLQANPITAEPDSLSNFSVPSALRYLQALHPYLK